MSSAVTIRKVETKSDHARSVQVRTIVFVVGQNVPSIREIDSDEESSHYFVALNDDEAVGTGRWRVDHDDASLAKVERLAVLDKTRGQGIGKQLMQYIIDDIKKNPAIKKIKLGSQDHAIPFYEALGFVICGPQYMDGGTIPHHDMILEI